MADRDGAGRQEKQGGGGAHRRPGAAGCRRHALRSRPACFLPGWRTRRRQPEGDERSGKCDGPRAGGHSPQAGAVHSSHGTWAEAAGWPQERSGVGEIRKAGKEGARWSERESRLGRRCLKRRRAGAGADPSRILSAPTAGPLPGPRTPGLATPGPQRCGCNPASKPPSPSLPLEDWVCFWAPPTSRPRLLTSHVALHMM